MTTTKLTKIIACILMAMILVTVSVSVVSASQLKPSDIESKVTYGDSTSNTELATMAGKVVGLIRNIAVIAGVILLTVIGIKFMMGSAEEKAEYKKSLVPLVVGIVVVMAATQIASMIFGFFNK